MPVVKIALVPHWNIFAKKATRERKIPFEVSADPFNSTANMEYLEKIIADIESGKAKFAEHDLIEDYYLGIQWEDRAWDEYCQGRTMFRKVREKLEQK